MSKSNRTRYRKSVTSQRDIVSSHSLAGQMENRSQYVTSSNREQRTSAPQERGKSFISNEYSDRDFPIEARKSDSLNNKRNRKEQCEFLFGVQEPFSYMYGNHYQNKENASLYTSSFRQARRANGSITYRSVVSAPPSQTGKGRSSRSSVQKAFRKEALSGTSEDTPLSGERYVSPGFSEREIVSENSSGRHDSSDLHSEHFTFHQRNVTVKKGKGHPRISRSRMKRSIAFKEELRSSKNQSFEEEKEYGAHLQSPFSSSSIRRFKRMSPEAILYGYFPKAEKSDKADTGILTEKPEMPAEGMISETSEVSEGKVPLRKGIFRSEKTVSPEKGISKKEQNHRDQAAAAAHQMREKRSVYREAQLNTTKEVQRFRRVYNPETKQFEYTLGTVRVPKSTKENILSQEGRRGIHYLHDNLTQELIKDDSAVLFNRNLAVEVADDVRNQTITASRTASAYFRQRKRTAPYRVEKKAKKQYEKKRRKYVLRKFKAENPNAGRIKQMRYRFRYFYQRKSYLLRQQGRRGGVGKAALRGTGRVLMAPLRYVVRYVSRKPVTLLVIFLCGALAIVSLADSVTSLVGIISSTSYASASQEDVLEVESYYVDIEQRWSDDTQGQLEKLAAEGRFPDSGTYDVMTLNLEGGFWHDPVALAAYMSVRFGDDDQYYLSDEVKAFLEELFYRQYRITWQYLYGIDVIYLDVTIENLGIANCVREDYREDQSTYERYQVIYEQKGNQPELFDSLMEDHLGGDSNTDYMPSSAAMSDADFAKIWNEASQYLGWHYQWGGSSPSTSFDCSGLVYWVYNHTGVASFGRTTAQGLFNMTTRIPQDQLQPGDLVFFAGTNSASPNYITHVGIYIGDGKMINAQSSGIKVANVFSGYWLRYYAGGGRL